MAKNLFDILITRQIIGLADVARIRKEAIDRNMLPEEILYEQGVSETNVAEAKSELTGFPTHYLQGIEVPEDALRDIPEESANFYKMIPLGRRDGYLEVGMLHPEDVASQEALKFVSARVGLPTRVFIITPTDFGMVAKEYRGLSGEVTRALGEFQKEYGEQEGAVRILQPEEQTITIEDAPVTKIVTVIIRHAAEGGASDIHIEPGRGNVRIRFRVDGILYTSLLLPSDVHAALVSRIKVMTNLKIDETRIPQDGRFHAEVLGRDIDFRVSTFPTAFKEKVVIRILDPAAGISELPDLGLTDRNLVVTQEEIKRPYGLVLITGPTGSGKSTTLYSILQILNQERVNIVSLEDPIEYYVAGVNQSQVRPEIGYDFAVGLRHIPRQDPDVIMVGEIRDKETAGLAIHAALTGHLVLSTLHTNSAIGVIPRLVDMSVDPFLMPPTLVLAIGQRLVRKLCPDSRRPVPFEGTIRTVMMREIESMPAGVREKAMANLPEVIYQSQSGPTCPKGTRGRVGVFEVLRMTPELEQIILSGASESKISTEAKRQEMLTMRQDGILKVLQGIIGYEELLEVI
ncbi:MAG: type II/IV secretion system protein [Candidatus Sungbacteria bacterium]|nr:type II/IV secretion system protein [Candidatus Sungbacteria bacterium]